MKTTIKTFIITLASLNIVAGVFDKEEVTMKRFLNHDYAVNVHTNNKEFANKACKAIRTTIGDIFRSKMDNKFVYSNNVECYIETNLDRDELSEKHEYLIDINETDEGQLDLSIANLHPALHDFKSLNWTLRNENSESTLNFISIAAAKIADYEINGQKYKNVLFYQALEQNGGYEIIDDNHFRHKKSNRTLNKEVAYNELIKNENSEERNFYRAGIELGTFLGIGKALYIAGHDSMKEDWDFDNETLEDYKERLFTTKQMRYDDNTIGMNWGHAYAGVLYYHSARNNGFSSKESFLVALAGSSIWEYFGENKEVVSINDQIATSIGGSVIGEVAYQISHMLIGKDSLAAKIVGSIINPIGMLNNWLDDKSFEEYHRNFSGEYGFKDNYERFDIIMGLTYLNNNKLEQTKAMLELGLEAEVINLPVHSLGKVNSVIYDPIFAELSTKAQISKDGIEDWHAITKLVLGGYFKKDISMTDENNKRGYSYFIGPSMRTEYRSRGIDHKDDFFAVVNVLGTTLDVTYMNNDVKMRFVVDVYADYAMVRPYGLSDYKSKGYDLEETMSVLKNRGYYHAFGSTQSAKFDIQYKRWSAGISAINHYFISQSDKELDRHPEKVKNKLDMRDEYTGINAYISYNTSRNFDIVLGLERIMRSGTLKSQIVDDIFKQSTTEDRIYLQVKGRY